MLARAILIALLMAPAAQASLWAAANDEAWRWDGSDWETPIPFDTPVFNVIAGIVGEDDDLYAWDSDQIQHYDGSTWTDITDDLSSVGNTSIQQMVYKDADEVYITYSNGNVAVYNGIGWFSFITYDVPGCTSPDVRDVDHVADLFVFVASCSSANHGIGYCLSPCAMQLEGVPDDSDPGTPDPDNFRFHSVACLPHDGSSLSVNCYAQGGRYLWLCGFPATTGTNLVPQCNTLLSDPNGNVNNEGPVNIYDSSFAIYSDCTSANIGCIYHNNGTSWVQDLIVSGGICSPSTNIAYAVDQAAAVFVCGGANQYRVYHYDEPAGTWVNDPPHLTNGRRTVVGGNPGVADTQATTQNTLPEFESGLVAFVTGLGFVTSESQLFFMLILVGLMVVASARMFKFMSSGRFKNQLMTGIAMLVGVVGGIIFDIPLWMTLLAIVLGAFTVQGGREARNTLRALRSAVARTQSGSDPMMQEPAPTAAAPQGPEEPQAIAAALEPPPTEESPEAPAETPEEDQS